MTRAATAHHEAGHAVVAVLFSFNVEYATIRPNGITVGHVKCWPRGRLDLDSGTPVMTRKMEQLVTVILAGDIAQRIYSPRSSRTWQTTSDRSAATDIALAKCGSSESATAFISWRTIVARDIVKGRWPIICKVAAALLDRETLSGDELRQIIFSR